MQFIYILFFLCTVFCSKVESLVVGMELSYPPFETIDPQGKATGVSVELAKALGDFLQVPIQIENIPYIGLIPALKTHKIDLIISSMTPTPQREESIAFSIPYLQTGLSLLVSKKSDLQSIDQADQPGRVIVVKQGTSGETYAWRHLQKAKVLILDKEASCVLEVVQGKADAFIYDQFSVYTNWQKNLDTTRAILTPFKVENWAIGVRKEDKDLLNKVNAFLTYFKANNGLEKIGGHYLEKQIEAFKQLGIPINF